VDRVKATVHARRGMLGPWLAHVLADVAIGAILVATR
jgi:hypothetical protein